MLAFALVYPAAAQIVISEFMADNATTGTMDVDRDRSDWIEIHNFGNSTVNLNGYYLTDSPDDLTRWRIPATNIVSKGYLLIFASGKNRAVAGQQLHTSFSLSAGGEYLAVVQPDGRTVSFEYAPEYPQQSPNISYGLAAGTLDTFRFFTTPTPALANTGGQPDVSEVPQFSVSGGAYPNSVTVALSATQPNTEIRYTVNGGTPAATSPLYTGPLTFANTTVLRAKAFTTGLVPSETVTHTYTILGTDVVNFSSNLPVLVLSTGGAQPSPDYPIPVSALLVSTNGGRATFTGQPDFIGRGTIKIRGSSSTQFPKKSFAFELQDELLQDRKESLLGMPKESDWVLYAPYTDKSLMRDFLAYEWSNLIGRYAPRTRFIEVYVDTSGGKLVAGDYAGVYVLIEKIKRDDDRVDIAPLLPTQITTPEVTGGYIWKMDRLDPGDVGFSTTRHSFGWVEPKEQEIVSQQRSYLVNYLTTFETALYAQNFATTKAYTNYIDTEAAIDHHWMVEVCRNIDGFRLSTYIHKDRLGKVVFGPIWDYNLSLGNANYADGWLTNGWYAPIVADSQYPWYRRLFADADFNQRYVDRWSEIRKSAFVTQQLVQRVDSLANTLREAAGRNYQRWPILGQYVWPNWYVGQTYQQEIDWMKWWMTNRLSWIDSQFVAAPQLSRVGGQVAPGTTVTISQAGASSLYYTTDGSDPRGPQGTISARAVRYTGPITINANTRIVARVYPDSNIWSPPAAATYVTATPPIVISEIMYNPADDPNGDYEFIELKNLGAAGIDLRGYRFTRGIDFIFTTTTALNGGASGVLVKNRTAFATRYPNANILGTFAGSLDNAGERITLEGPMLEPIHDFTYNNAWFPATDGHGFSIVPRDLSQNRALWDSREGWRASASVGGSPSQNDPAVERPTILITEVLSNSDAPTVDAIELFNPGPAEVDIGNWFLSDDRSNVKKYKIPAPRIMEAGEYALFTEAHFNTDPQSPASFAIGSDGDEVVLFSADAAGNLTGGGEVVSFGAAAVGVTFGRHISSDANVHFTAQISETLGRANSGPRVGPVVINEIAYVAIGTGVEFIELKNITAEAVPLYDPARPQNRWRLSGVDYTFPANASIPANGLAVVVGTDPATFRTMYNLPPEVAVYGPWQGSLQDDGELLELRRPDVPGLTTVPMVVVDAVRYNDRAPWPAVGVGAGYSLEKILPNTFGNDPAHWRGSFGEPSPGLNNDGNRRPLVTVGASQTISSTRFPIDAQLTGQATDDGNPADPGRLSYRWTQVSGPWASTFADDTQATATVSIPGPGSYRFRFTANDGAAASSAEVVVTVSRPGNISDLVARGSEWLFLDNGSNQQTAWREANFDDSAWRRGRAELGYGDNDEATVVGWGPDANARYITTYFRKSFTLDPTLTPTALRLRVLRDDGVIVYINGREAWRNNMPGGTIFYTTPASTGLAAPAESTFVETSLATSFVQAGPNTIAAEVHQFNGQSVDLSFDLQLEGTFTIVNQAPQVNAGPDRTAAPNVAITLDGVVTDDALPISPGVPAITWRAPNNANAVVFGTSNRAKTTATFSAPGSYVLELSANDGTLTAQDWVTVTVTDDFPAWAAAHFTAAELADSNISGENADPDGDTLTNRQEFLTGTDPKSAASVLKFEVTASGGIRFEAMPNVAYRVLFRTLESDTWTTKDTYPAEASRRDIDVTGLAPGLYRIASP